MRLRWNPDGKGPRAVPPHLVDFAQRKRNQFLRTLTTSAVAGLAIGRCVDWATGEVDALELPSLVAGVKGLAVSMGLGVALSFLA